MVRKSMWAALAVLLAYAPGALAYQYDVTQTATLMYAKELFGTGSASSRVEYCRTVEAGCPSAVPKITLWTVLGDDGDENAVDPDDEMDITLTLRGAVFAFGFRSSHIAVRSYATDNIADVNADSTSGDYNMVDNREVSVVREDDGASGDSSVSFMAKATGSWGDDDADNVATVIEIEIELPELRGLNGRTPVTATIVVDAAASSGFMSSDEELATVGGGTAKSPNGGVLRAAGTANAQGVRPSTPLLNFADALSFSNAGGCGVERLEQPDCSARINLAAGRTSIAGRSPFAFLARPRVGVPNPGIAQLNGETFSVANRQNGQGDLVISVTGQFHSGDIVFLDLNGNWDADSDERLSLRDGIMSGRFNLIEIAGTGVPGASAEAERQSEEGEANRWLLFRPNGVDALRPADYRTTMSVDFTHARNVDKDGQNSIAVDLTTSYTVIDSNATRRAYSIPPLGGSDMGNVRIKCETAVDCPLYLECDDSAGDAWFQELDEGVPARSTMRLTSAMIATHLGISEDGWEGRLACSVMSTQNISVQVLTRSGDVLVNNTYIDMKDD